MSGGISDHSNWIALPSRLLCPFTPGTEAIRDILLDHRTLTTLHSGWGPGWLLTQPLLLTTAGVLAFTRLERLALQRGTLGRY